MPDSNFTPFVEPVEFDYPSEAPSHSHRVLRPPVEKFLEGTPPGAKILDLGCGNGSFLAPYRDRKWQLYGVDSSHSGIEVAKKYYPGIHFIESGATDNLAQELGERQFDVVICTEVVEHVYNPRGLARNCFQLLKPGGFLIISTPYHGYLKNLILAVTGTMERHYDPLYDHGHIKFWSRKTLPLLLREQGFERLEFEGAGRFSHLWMSMVYKAFRPKA